MQFSVSIIAKERNRFKEQNCANELIRILMKLITLINPKLTNHVQASVLKKY